MYRYYNGHPKDMLTKIKCMYNECDTENKVFTVFILILIIVSIIVGVCT